jgi:hypothetical protein
MKTFVRMMQPEDAIIVAHGSTPLAGGAFFGKALYISDIVSDG